MIRKPPRSRSTASPGLSRAIGLVLATLVLPWPPSSASAQAAWEDEIRWRGPMRVRSQFPIDLLTLDLTPAQAALLDDGQWSLDLLLVHSNTFELTEGYDPRVEAWDEGSFSPFYDFNVDSETTRLTARIDWAISSRVQLGLEIPLLHHDEGFLDDLIDEVHETLDLPVNDRDKKPQDVLNIDVISGDRRQRLGESDSAVGDVVARVKLGLHRGPRSAVAAVLEAKAPTGDEESFAGSGAWDYGASLLWSVGTRRHVFHGGLGHQWIGEPEALPVALDDRTSLFLGYELAASERWSFATHVMAATSALPDSPLLDNDEERAELVVGFHWGGRTWEASAGFVENITTNDNTPDLGVFFGVAWRR